MLNQSKFGHISIVGLGYIGLPTAALFAARGHRVTGVDINPIVVDTVNAGKIHIVEPELDGIVRKAVGDGRLTATTTPEAADVFVIAVPTPIEADKQPNVDYVKSAAEMVAAQLTPGNLVILESTSPVGTTRKMAEWMAVARPDLSFPQDAGEEADVMIAYCPERVLPGKAVHELVENDRVIGGMSRKAASWAREFYSLVVRGTCIETNAETAEMTKLVENSSRDVQIAFANELSLICDKLGIDVFELISLANRHPRVNILQPGPGVGGHCIAVDPWFIIAAAPEESQLIRLARDINDAKPRWVVEKVKAAIIDVLVEAPERSLSDLTVACFGLAFKANIDDLRESPSLEITRNIASLGCKVLAIEPHIDDLPADLASTGVTLAGTEEALEAADVVCVLVKHNAFQLVRDQILSSSHLIDLIGL